jgi:hypothetical protein
MFIFLDEKVERIRTKDVHFIGFRKNVAELFGANRRFPSASRLQESNTFAANRSPRMFCLCRIRC